MLSPTRLLLSIGIAAGLAALAASGSAFSPAHAQAPSTNVPAAPPPVAAPPPATDTNPATPGQSQPSGQTAPTGQNAPATDGAEPVGVAMPPGSVTANLPHDLSPWSMFMQADIVVKAVMVGLAFASLVTWTIWLAKGLELLAAQRRARVGLTILEEATDLNAAAGELQARSKARGPVAELISAAQRESKRSEDLSSDGIKERASIALSRIEAKAGRSIQRGTGLLATIGATAPFVGLFGTVWGIMNSFISISVAKTTNLAVVAPGIAEALLATAIGLVAAIPAVIIYNVFARGIAGYRALLSDASGQVLQHMSRDLDRKEAAGGARPVIRAAE